MNKSWTARRKRRRKFVPEVLESQESRGAVAVTVAWMLSLLATLLAVSGTLLARLLLAWVQPSASEPNLLAVLPGLLLFVGVVSATLCLLLTVAANRIRHRPPPRLITLFALVACTLPWMLLVF